MHKKTAHWIIIGIFLLGCLAWQFPAPSGMSLQGWHLTVIFMCTILGVILNPVPMSVTALLGALICILTKVLTLDEALSGFASSIIWIVVFAFFIARGFIKTGLARRIAYLFIAKFGNTTLGLAYSLVTTEFLLSPMIPSVTARGGGIIYPITKALLDAYAVSADPEATHKTGGFLLKVCFQANVITCAMFITAMAGNPLAVSLAAKMGITITWSSWALGAIVPGIASLLLLPLVLYVICPPAIKRSSCATEMARQALKEMGALGRNELFMLVTFIGLIALWILDAKIGLSATTSALIGVLVLILSGVLTWEEALNEKGAWDTMVWFAVLLMMSGFLGKLGVMAWAGNEIKGLIGGEGTHPALIIITTTLIYLYIHYFFASVTAHIAVFYAIFVGLLIQLGGMNPLPAALLLAYVSSLSAGLTHYGNASAPIFYNAGYLTTIEWWRSGLLVSLLNLLVWGGIGFSWWSFLGWI